MVHRSKDTNIAILGDGGWGTTLAIHLAKQGHAPILWGAFPKYLAEIETKRENRKFLPGFHIPENVRFQCQINDCVSQSSIVILAAPSQYLRSVLKLIRVDTRKRLWINASKGIENRSLKLMSQVIEDELGSVTQGVISGPTIAREVASDTPTALVVGARQAAVRKSVRSLLNAAHFTVYESHDPTGVELGGAIKNVIAIAAGIVDGLGFGTNTKSILIARGIAEMARLGVAMGAKRTTFMGLSGLGDLATTSFSIHSRNHGCGVDLGQGLTLAQIRAKTEMVIEGIDTTESAFKLARKYRVRMPIVQSVHEILFKRHRPRATIEALMEKTLVKETD